MSQIKIDDLTVRYPFQNADILTNINVDIEKGENILILGPSGGGKSTLAFTLNGLIPNSFDVETSGRVLIDKQPVTDIGLREMSQQIGILFQDPETQFCMETVEEEVLFGLENLQYSKKDMEKRMLDSLTFVGLQNWRSSRIHELSGGMKQKLGIACILAMDPDVLILDEPTANLDPASTTEMFALFERISRQFNKTIILIEHKLDQVLSTIDRVLVLNRHGKLMADATPRAVFENDYDQLTKEGVWVPQLVQYAKQLEKKGIKWPAMPLTFTEWQQAWQALGLPEPTEEERHLTEEEEGVSREPILQINNVSFSYKNRTVLEEVKLSVQKGDFLAIVGPNGAGKSTLSQMLIGLLQPEHGEIVIDGVSYEKLRSEALMRQIGFVFQNPEHQFIADSVEEELAYGFKVQGWKEADWKPYVNELLDTFQLTEQAAQNPFSLSQGQKRRLSVATMLTNDQEILILDEPTFGQDQENTEALMALLKDWHARGKTIIMITHDMDLVYQYADHVALLQSGKVAYHGHPSIFFQRSHLLKKASIQRPLSYELQPWVHAVQKVGV
ncbi:ABC transporter ATP-binding protein [Texcoconibacillus texcoconensis]|uniref:Energy-coupling factor transport system ATP-binding protein n=1 Tax=Texcoconibacillus texcoconensis TaxID=1095777 RepID=A0A840QPR9_9BACI|nr:ABC transporter ATP-binding protein [Texcoconibacillus texcoconensis]MBB5173412.1 energy-coupling factor transport system ATP-binding protein [Texcoconibacillus texcoconensis]